MCIIAAKQAGIDFPANFKSLMAACFSSNRDGAGLMFKRKGEKAIHVHKGLMSFEDFWEVFQRLKLQRQDEFVAHFRIGTSGGKSNPEMTHPFPIVKNKDDLRRKFIILENGAAMCHNGIMYEYVDRKNFPSFSDTALFVSTFLYKYQNLRGRDLKRWRKKLHRDIKHQKLAILYSNSRMELLGEYVYYRGLFFSNSGFSGWRSYTTEASFKNLRSSTEDLYSDFEDRQLKYCGV